MTERFFKWQGKISKEMFGGNKFGILKRKNHCLWSAMPKKEIEKYNKI